MELVDGIIPVLLYHRIIKRGDAIGRHKIYVYEDKFYRQMKLLKDAGYTSVTFEDIHEKKVTGNKNVIITFDDGYEDNSHVAFPVLKEFGYKAVVFLVTRLQNNAWGIAEGEPAMNMMNDIMLKEMLDYGYELGGHTQTHPDLTKANLNQIQQEIEGCKSDIEQRFGNHVLSFAYPFGGITADVKRMVAESGFVYGISTKFGSENFFDDLLQIRRREIGPKTTLCSFKKKTGIKTSLLNNWFLNFNKK